MASIKKDLRPVQFGPPPIHWLRYIVPLVIAGLAVHFFLPQLTNLEQAWQTVLQMPPWLIVFAVVAQVASYGGSGYLLTSLAYLLNEDMPLSRGVVLTLAGTSIGLVAGGMLGMAAATYRWAVAGGHSKKTASLCGTLPLLFTNLLLALLATLGLVHLLIVHQLSTLEIVGYSFALAWLLLLVSSGAWGATHPAQLLTLLVRLDAWWGRRRHRPANSARLTNGVNHLANTWLVMLRGGWRGPAVGAALILTGDMLTLFILFAAADHEVSPGVLLTGYGLPLLMGKIGFFPGGVGIVEGLMTAIYIGLGVPADVTVVVILGYRLISFWLPTLIGFPLAAYLQYAARTPRAAAADE